MKNLFIQAVTGSWEFGSMDAFLNDSPSKYVFEYTDPDVTGGNYRYTPIIKARSVWLLRTGQMGCCR
ncbi:MAG: hypothetical protein ACLR6J_16905 [Parabacteroides merdae]